MKVNFSTTNFYINKNNTYQKTKSDNIQNKSQIEKDKLSSADYKHFALSFGSKIVPPQVFSEIIGLNQKVGQLVPIIRKNRLYQQDVDKFSDYLVKKIAKQAEYKSPFDIDKMVKQISAKTGFPEKIVIKTMSKITQFSSYAQLKKLGEKLTEQKISDFYDCAGLTTNTVMEYLRGEKRQFDLHPIGKKQAFILDNEGLKFLEAVKKQNLPDSGLEDFPKLINKGLLVLVNLDGTGIKLGDKYYSCSIFDGSHNLAKLTEAILRESKDGNIEKVINGDYAQRIEKLFGKEARKKILNINIEYDNPNIFSIAKQLKPNMPDKYQIKTTIEKIVEHKLNNDAENKQKAMQTLVEYYDKNIRFFSPDTMVKTLKERHLQLKQQVKALGRTMKDVVYIRPKKYKSFELVDFMYAKANNVPLNKFIYTNEFGSGIPDDKVVVILDDIFGSGDTVLDDSFKYKEFVKTHPEANFIFSAMICTNYAKNAINKEIKAHGRTNKDFILADTVSEKQNTYINEISILPEKVALFNKINRDNGVGGSGLCICFPYMVPDNVSEVGGYLMLHCLNDVNSESFKPLETITASVKRK